MVEIWTENYPAVTGEEERKVYIYLPTDYETQRYKSYPVLYMFDGQNVFFDEESSYGRSWRMGDFLDFTDTPLIVVAIECSRSSDNERLSEYTPFTFEDPEYGHRDARGDITMNWIIDELMPKINANFRTFPNRENTFIMGSSMGGLMSLYAVLEHNEIFGACAALSPSVELVEKQINEYVNKCKIKNDTVIYMDYGTEEAKDYPGVLKSFSKLAAKLAAKDIMVTMRIIPYAPHSEESWEKQIPFAISTLLYEP